MQINIRYFMALQLEKLALFNLAYICHPPIKPNFPSRQNYPILSIRYFYMTKCLSIRVFVFVFFVKLIDILVINRQKSIGDHRHCTMHTAVRRGSVRSLY